VLLDLTGNSIQAIPNSLECKNLKTLKVAKNGIDSLPKEFPLFNLEELDLSRSCFELKIS
jgi:Leucine-rich repeat (LRR) protein